ncbi:hypothetical protein OG322_33825 [Streptomyces sp. NBC_01260]|uniref:hypothetical protein n=1 Tax=unclassified Streptomyces TaxID=2593676 RepID=UPI001F14ACDC|nr:MULTISPECIES: hypothetical protein [unclassified Streptomyces]
MRGTVAEHDTDLPAEGDRPVESVQEVGAGRRVVADDRLREYLAGADVARGDEGGRAVAPVLQLLPVGFTSARWTAGTAT